MTSTRLTTPLVTLMVSPPTGKPTHKTCSSKWGTYRHVKKRGQAGQVLNYRFLDAIIFKDKLIKAIYLRHFETLDFFHDFSRVATPSYWAVQPWCLARIHHSPQSKRHNPPPSLQIPPSPQSWPRGPEGATGIIWCFILWHTLKHKKYIIR